MQGNEKSFDELVALVAAVDPDLVAASEEVDGSLIEMVLARSLLERIDVAQAGAEALKGLRRDRG